MSAPIVQVLFKDRVLKSISFEGDSLRIGRLRQNDVVIDNLSVSRFHATLNRRDGRTFLEDNGSENGCFVNGMRVERTEVKPGDEILIGKHQLVLLNPGEAVSEPPRPALEGSAEPWDGQKTYMMGRDTVDGLLGGAGGAGAGAGAGSIAADPPPVADDYDVSVDDMPPVAEAEAPAPAASPSARYPGFVMQTDGRFDRVLRWETDRLSIGRSSECDIALSHPEVSRRHALFHREGERFEVRDLDSINGTLVNGKRIKRQELAVGDVVKIENFEFTFVLEPQPIGNEVKTTTLPPRAARRPQVEDDDLTVLEERSPLEVSQPSPLDEVTAPNASASQGLPPAPVAPSADPCPAVAPAPVPAAPELRVAAAPLPLAPTPSHRPPAGEITLEVRVSLDALPLALREAIEDSGVALSEALPVRAEVRLVREKDSD